MKNKLRLAGLVLVLSILACNWPELLPPAAPEIRPTVLPTFVVPSDTPVPSATLPPTASPTPGVPIAWPKDKAVNCRFGPGTEWTAVSALPEDVHTFVFWSKDFGPFIRGGFGERLRK